MIVRQSFNEETLNFRIISDFSSRSKYYAKILIQINKSEKGDLRKFYGENFTWRFVSVRRLTRFATAKMDSRLMLSTNRR